MAKGWLSKWFGRGRPKVRAAYDAARTTPDNRKHWAAADAFSPDSAMSADVRRTLRIRARYEVANNSYAKGIVLTLANDLIGTGPNLQVHSHPRAKDIESRFWDWCVAIDLPRQLRTMRMARAVDGESFALLQNNPALPGIVKLDVTMIEADQVADPTASSLDSDRVDGIRHDSFGRPISYRVLDQHPGDTSFLSALSFRDFPARAVVHYFRRDRAGQSRGIPDITPALPLFAEMRRYSMAVLAAAETAASFAIVLKSTAPADADNAKVCMPFDEVEIDRRMATVLPDGYDMGQTKPEQPTSTHDSYIKTILREIGRCLNMPYNVVAGDSSGHNYSSGRLDHQTYHKSVRVERSELESLVLDRLFRAWLSAARVFYADFHDIVSEEVRVSWVWDGFEHVDPQKESTAQITRLSGGLSTFQKEFAAMGLDAEEQHTIAASELGITLKEYRAALLAKMFPSPPMQAPVAEPTTDAPDDPDPEDDDEEDGEGEDAAARLHRNGMNGVPITRMAWNGQK